MACIYAKKLILVSNTRTSNEKLKKKKKLSLIYLKFKPNWESCILVC